jgi:hypothetical protein
MPLRSRDAQRHARQRKSDYLQTLEQHVQAHETLARECVETLYGAPMLKACRIQAENAALRCIIEEQKATLARLFAGPSPTYVTLDTPALSSLWTPLSPSVTSSATETPVSAFTSPASSYSPLPCIAPSDCIASTAYDRMSAPDGTRRASGGPYSQLADAFLGLMPPPSPILRTHGPMKVWPCTDEAATGPVELPPMWSSAPPMGSFSPLALPTPHCWQGDGLGLDVAPSPSSNWFS